MVNLKVISKRLKSLQNIKKITRSMKMVSASRYTRAERDLDFVRPYGEAAAKFYKEIKAEVPKDIPGKERLYIAVTSDKGLCGAVHNNIGKHVKECVVTEPESKVVCVGDKSRLILNIYYSNNIVLVASEVGKKPATFSDTSRLTDHILRSEYQPFNDGKIVFNKTKNIMSYSTKYLPIVGMAVLLQTPKMAFYDDVDNEVLQSYLEYSLASLIFYAMKENVVAELSARMNAMESASKNASDMINDLSVTFNRTRQAVVTKEITEIISGIMD